MLVNALVFVGAVMGCISVAVVFALLIAYGPAPGPIQGQEKKDLSDDS